MMPMGAAIARTKATPVDRFVGLFIDAVIMVPVYFVVGFALGMVSPMVAGLVGGLIAGAWMLLRDAKGWSIGKKVMNLEVVSKDGMPVTQDQLMKRNFTLAAGNAGSGIPFVGMFFGLIGLVEGILLLAKGERYGDTMANTMVVKRG
jgi:uncharacterized RDD family membrane protein YckC